MRSWLFFLPVMLLALAVCPPVRGEPVMAPQDLYLDAMRSLAEGRQYDANDALMRMIELEPQHAGAWLDLAIIQCKLGHAAEAERLFGIIESRFSPPPGILEVIASQRTNGCQGWQPHSQWSLLLGRGADNNVNQGASNPSFSIGSGTTRIDLDLTPDYLPRHDQYTFLSSEFRRNLTPNGDVGFVQFRARQNDSIKRYDTASLVMGLEKPWRFGEWGMKGVASLGLLSLGDQLYQKQGQIQARILPPLALPNGFQFSVLAGLSHLVYPTLANFDSNIAEVGGMLAYQGKGAQIQGSFTRLSDHRPTDHLGGNRHGWTASLLGHARIADNLNGELGWSRQSWMSQSAYSPGLIDQTQRQDSQLWRAALVVPIATHHSLLVEWRQIRNDDNISLFQYNSRLVQASWLWQSF